MFNESFYPTPAHVIELMIGAEDLQGKTILEPSAGKGDILDYCKDKGAETLLACEVNPTLQVIVKHWYILIPVHQKNQKNNF